MKASRYVLVGMFSLAGCTTFDVQTTEQACLHPGHAESKSFLGQLWDWAFGPACGSSDFYAGLAAYDRADYETAAKIWQPQADSGLARAQFHLAGLYAAGTGVDPDPILADELYRAAAANGYNGQYYNLMMADSGEDPTDQPWYDAIAYAKRQTLVDAFAAADVVRDLEDAALAVAAVRPRAKPDSEPAFEEAARARKSDGAEVSIAIPVSRPALPAENDDHAAPTLASLGDAAVRLDRPSVDVAFNAGMTAYMRGRYRDALQRWSALADQGEPRAQTWLGIMHENGQGVARDDAEAIRWYRLAADQGYAEAQFSLGLNYDKGLGVAEDAATAAHWYQRAAEQGHTDSQFRLGLMYLNGRGVASDLKLAHVWFGFAAAQGDTIAQESMDLVRLGMTGADLADAEALARQWQQRIAATQRELAGS